MGATFTWDEGKASSNTKKHRVSFVEAVSVFDDPNAIIFYDAIHSREEEREIIIGYSPKGRLLSVAFTERAAGEIRIISARKATRPEGKEYEEAER